MGEEFVRYLLSFPKLKTLGLVTSALIHGLGRQISARHCNIEEFILICQPNTNRSLRMDVFCALLEAFPKVHHLCLLSPLRDAYTEVSWAAGNKQACRQIRQLSFEGCIRAPFYGQIIPHFTSITHLGFNCHSINVISWLTCGRYYGSNRNQPKNRFDADPRIINLLLGALSALDTPNPISYRLTSLLNLELSGFRVEESGLRLLVKRFLADQKMELQINNCSLTSGIEIPSSMERLEKLLAHLPQPAVG